MAEPEELRYFAFEPDNDYHVRARSAVVRAWDEYLAYFSIRGDSKAVGEASPNYLRSPGAAARIKAALPHVKLIVSIRNPADRLYSIHQMSSRRGSTDLPFDQQAFCVNACWIKRNFYWPDLKHQFELFDRQQIKILLFEDIVNDPVRVSQCVYRFLGVDDDFVAKIDIHNLGGVPMSRLSYSFLLGVRRTLKHLIDPPDSLKKYWTAVRKRSLKRVPINSKLRRQILAVCRDDILRTQELTAGICPAGYNSFVSVMK